MKIKLIPIGGPEQLTARVDGDILTVNGVSLDFSPLPEGGMLPNAAISSLWVFGDVRRVDGEVYLTLVLPHSNDAPHETRFPAAYDVPMTVVDGLVPLPPYDAPPVVEDVQLPDIEPEVTP
ncbi:hypothetical protein OR604_16405 [Aeromonas caviae]|uniref:hypothetical protein n=1 Tax=Aeromonas caviae TaxID=648 RepID=UPI002252770E|nr:hypothetical protein [Aeromonas caviae]MCX4037769.1 hypothetical protein [Aeromonas caviae]